MRYLLFILITSLSISLMGQFTDDFSDGDFTNNPTWAGEADKFIVNINNELQLYDAPQTGTAYLSTESEAINNAKWEFLIKFDFNPSSANYADIYLSANTPDLSGELNGYFVRLGNTADEVCLYKQSGTTKTKIIDGIDDRLNSNFVNVRVKVTRDDIGNWVLFSDTLGGTDYLTEGFAFDNTHISSFYFGVKSIFSSSRWDKMFFDDFTVTGDAFIDNIAPEFIGYLNLSDTEIQLNFSEPMDPTTSLNPLNYQVNGGIENPDAVNFVPDNPDKIILSFNQSFASNQAYTVFYQNLEDLAGNQIETGNFSFSMISVEVNDIIINELMPDPSPVVNLPDNEYLELYNRRDLSINLTNWKLKIGNSEYIFPNTNISANGYLIVCDEVMYDEYAVYGDAVGLDFPAYFLSNTGTSVQLFDDEDNLITSVSYTYEWYQDPNKNDGGWSIERIDPNNTCSGINNWAASEDPNGGTPGTENSIFGEYIDSEAPEIITWELTNANELSLTFNELPDIETLLNYSNYNLSPDIGEPIFISQNENNPRIVNLQFESAFLEKVYYTLSIQNISDMCGNTMPPTEITFVNYITTHFDIVFSEIMADPSPPVYLPNAEYVELYNRAEYPINLAGWKFLNGNTETILPAIEIPVNGYICLTKHDYLNEFSGIENVYGVYNLSSLTNSYGELQLISPQGKLIHFLNYSEDWYQSSTKKEGGWSLEMKALNNPCAGGENWKESNSETGGTPGQPNSVSSNLSDNYAPNVLRAIIHKPDTLRVYFNETLHPAFQPKPEKFNVNNTIGAAITAERITNRLDGIELIFSTAFEANTIYTLTMTDTITDCVGNLIEENLRTTFALPDSVEPQDIVINEILFNPLTGGSDYVELYNRSEKFINLSDLRIATRDDSLMIDKVSPITEVGFILFPDDHVVISKDIISLERDYYCQNPELLLKVNDLPNYANTLGRAVLCTRNLQVIDEMYYHEDWHFQLLKEVKGVSLERIDYNQPAADENNWHSAAESVGFGTPTYKNSQYQAYGKHITSFELSPESISPDNDGYQDYLNIHYQMEQSGVVLSITIYNAAGHLIRNLTENEMLGSEGVIQWDGLDNNNQHPGTGIYIVLLDYFDLQGNRKQEKHTCIVAVMR